MTLPHHTRGRNRVFVDPFTHSFDSSIQLLTGVGRQHGVLDKHAAIQPELIDIQSFSYLGQVTSEESLCFAFERFDEFEKSYNTILTGMKKAEDKARAEWRKASIAGFHREAESQLENLKTMKASLTPVHLTLQRHFYRLVVGIPRNPNSDDLEVAAFFDELYALRNAFFEAHQKDLIVEYLNKVDALVSESYYSETVISNVDPMELVAAQAKVDESRVALEVLDILDEF